MKIVVLCPHFEPDTAPTGVVMTRIVRELADLGHELHVVTALPWYRAASDRAGVDRAVVAEATHRRGVRSRVCTRSPATTSRTWLGGRAGFVGFSVAGGRRRAARRWVVPACRCSGCDVAAAHARDHRVGGRVLRRAPLVFNVQDVFPDAAVRTGAITDRRVIACRALARAVHLSPGGGGHGAQRRPARAT